MKSPQEVTMLRESEIPVKERAGVGELIWVSTGGRDYPKYIIWVDKASICEGLENPAERTVLRYVDGWLIDGLGLQGKAKGRKKDYGVKHGDSKFVGIAFLISDPNGVENAVSAYQYLCAEVFGTST